MEHISAGEFEDIVRSLPRDGVVGQALQSLLFMGGHAIQWVNTSQNLSALNEVRTAIGDIGSVHSAFLQEHIQRLIDAGRAFDPDFCWTWERYVNEIASAAENNMETTLADFHATAQSEFVRLTQDLANKALRLQAVFGTLNVLVGFVKLKNGFDALSESAAGIAENGTKLNAIRELLGTIEAKLPTVLQMIENNAHNRANVLVQDCREQLQACWGRITNLKTNVEGRIVTVKNVLDDRFMDLMHQSISAVGSFIQLLQVGAQQGEIQVVEDRCARLQDQFRSIAQEIAAQLDNPAVVQ